MTGDRNAWARWEAWGHDEAWTLGRLAGDDGDQCALAGAFCPAVVAG